MKYKWTVLFLVHASNKKTRVHANVLFDTLKNTKYSKEIKVLVLYGGLQHSPTENYSIQLTLIEIIKDDITNQLILHEVEPGYGRIDMGNDKRLSQIFSDIRVKYSSERFLLFTWDHGSGFGIFKTDPRERRLFGGNRFINFNTDFSNSGNIRSLSPMSECIEFSVITNYSDGTADENGETRGISGTEKKRIKTSMLTNDELGDIIKYSFEGKKVDLLIMMNCSMQMIETGYALHDAVEYLVAPETCIFWEGYDYISIINKLCSVPEIETEALGKYTLDTIKPYYYKTSCKDYYNDLVVSLVKPARSKNVKRLIDEMSGYLTANIPDSFHAVKAIRQNCEDITQKYVEGTPYHYIDFLNCATGLHTISDQIDLESLEQAVKDYVIHLIKGNNYCGMNRENNTCLFNGFSIYYPPSAEDADSDLYYEWFYKAGNHQTLFAAECSWQDFLIEYLKTDRRAFKKERL